MQLLCSEDGSPTCPGSFPHETWYPRVGPGCPRGWYSSLPSTGDSSTPGPSYKIWSIPTRPIRRLPHPNLLPGHRFSPPSSPPRSDGRTRRVDTRNRTRTHTRTHGRTHTHNLPRVPRTDVLGPTHTHDVGQNPDPYSATPPARLASGTLPTRDPSKGSTVPSSPDPSSFRGTRPDLAETKTTDRECDKGLVYTRESFLRPRSLHSRVRRPWGEGRVFRGCGRSTPTTSSSPLEDNGDWTTAVSRRAGGWNSSPSQSLVGTPHRVGSK